MILISAGADTNIICWDLKNIKSYFYLKGHAASI